MKTSGTRPSCYAWVLLLVLTCIWGSSFILIKKGLLVYSAPQVAAIRILAASLFMIPFALSWMRRVPKRRYPIILVSGFIGSFIPAFLFALAQTRLDSAITGMVNALTPVFVLIIGLLFYRQKMKMYMFIGLAMALGGTAILVFYGSAGSYQFNYFALFVVLATVLYGINVNLLKFNLSDLSPVAISSISILFIGPMAGLYLFGASDFTDKLSAGDYQTWLALGYLAVLGVIGTSLALILFNYLIKITTPLFSSSVTYLIPIVALTWGLLDGEKLTALHYAAMGFIIFGVFVANKKN